MSNLDIISYTFGENIKNHITLTENDIPHNVREYYQNYYKKFDISISGIYCLKLWIFFRNSWSIDTRYILYSTTTCDSCDTFINLNQTQIITRLGFRFCVRCKKPDPSRLIQKIITDYFLTIKTGLGFVLKNADIISIILRFVVMVQI